MRTLRPRRGQRRGTQTEAGRPRRLRPPPLPAGGDGKKQRKTRIGVLSFQSGRAVFPTFPRLVFRSGYQSAGENAPDAVRSGDCETNFQLRRRRSPERLDDASVEAVRRAFARFGQFAAHQDAFAAHETRPPVLSQAVAARQAPRMPNLEL